jgi:hypothetical protein
MTVRWLLESHESQPDPESPLRLALALDELGMPRDEFRYVPFGGSDTSVVERLARSDDRVVFYGTINGHDACVAALRGRPPRPFSWVDAHYFRPTYYNSLLGSFALQQDWDFIRFDSIPDRGAPGVGMELRPRVFVRPDDHVKTFTGEVVATPNLVAWHRYARDTHMVPHDTMVLVCPVQEIDAEWRFVCVLGEPVAGSKYREAGLPAVERDWPVAAATTARAGAHLWNKLPVCVCDVCRLASGEYRVVEIGPFNYAGLYACDPLAVAAAVGRAAEAA